MCGFFISQLMSTKSEIATFTKELEELISLEKELCGYIKGLKKGNEKLKFI